MRKVERFFQVARIHPDDRVVVISNYLMGKASDYYEWAMEEDPLLSWEKLKFSMGQRFGSKEFKSPQEQHMGVKQKESIDEYGEQFSELFARICGMDREVLLAAFLNGLSFEL